MLLAVAFLLAAMANAQDFDGAARELARKIEIASRRQEIGSLTVQNLSTLPEAVAAQVRRELESELRIRPARPGVERLTVQVTLSENLQCYLWVALVGREDAVMLVVERPAARAAAPAPASIQKRLLWDQERPILDAAVSGGYLIVLDPSAISLYRDGQLARAFPIPARRPMPRDPRGRLSITGDSFRAFLPDAICNGTIVPAPAAVCTESVAWPLAAGRNYFSEPGLPPYFSSADLPGGKLIVGVDGRTHLYDGSGREGAQWSGWGSDIAPIDAGCDRGPSVLASKSGDGVPADAVQLYTIAPSGPTPAGEAAVFPGPVVALWPSSQKGEAIAIARNSETGRYAAYSLAITCNR